MHKTRIRQAPGWWASIVRAECSCGWRGHNRDANTSTGTVLAKLDADEHKENQP